MTRGVEPDRPTPDFAGFLSQIENGDIESAEARQEDNTVKVEKRDGTEYEIGFVDGCGQPFLGREFSSEPDYSDELARGRHARVRSSSARDGAPGPWATDG